MKANPQLKAAVASMDAKSKAELSQLNAFVHATVRRTVASKKPTTRRNLPDNRNEYGLPGVLPPLDFWDPFGLSTDIDKGRLLYYREAEIKHGRVCMSGSLGFLVAERYHPLFGGDIDAPALFTPLETNLRTFW